MVDVLETFVDESFGYSSLVVYSDSALTISAIMCPDEVAGGTCPGPETRGHKCSWLHKWRDEGSYATRANVDQYTRAEELIAQLRAKGVAVRMEHVYGHRTHVGNNFADLLASVDEDRISKSGLFGPRYASYNSTVAALASLTDEEDNVDIYGIGATVMQYI